MALIKATDQVKKWFSSIDNDYNIVSLQSFINDAELDYLIPEIGIETYTAINTAFNAGPLSGKLAELFPYLEKAVTHLALMLSADSGGFRIADSGYYVSSTSTSKPVSDKKLSEFKKGRHNAAYKAIEQAIQYLEANVNDAAFTAYLASDQHKAARKYFINNAVDFTNYYQALNNSSVTFRAFRNALDRSEREYILPLLGQPLFDKLKAHVLADTLTSDEQLLIPLIGRALANYTVAEAVPKLPIEFDGINLVVNSMPTTGNSENANAQTAANPQQIIVLVRSATIDGQKELRRLEKYLIANYATYPDYVLPPVADQADINLNDTCSNNFFV